MAQKVGANIISTMTMMLTEHTGIDTILIAENIYEDYLKACKWERQGVIDLTGSAAHGTILLKNESDNE